MDEGDQVFEAFGFDEAPTEYETDGPDESGSGLQGSEHVARRVRLKVKTHPSLAKGYTERKLLNRREHKIQQHKAHDAKKRRNAEFKSARKRAIELLASQPPTGAFGEDEFERGEIDEHPHQSHCIVAVNCQGETIFCKRCGHCSSKSN